MEILSNMDLSTVCRMCTSNLLDQECYAIDEDLEELIFTLTTLKFDHVDEKENLRMCVNCFDCLKSFNDFRTNCINIHEKLIQLDLAEKDSDYAEELYVEEITEPQEIIAYKTEAFDEFDDNSDEKIIENEVEYAVERLIEDDYMVDIDTKHGIKKSHPSTEKGKQTYQKLLQNCTVCGKMVEKNRLEGHINKHNNVRPYSCPECKKEFYCKQLLRLHRTSIHTNIKIKCDICDKFFPSTRALYAHTLRHKNENRYVCTLCDKKFNNANSLKRHMAIHSGVREFVCSVCGVGFYRKFNLDVHVKNVHNQTKEFTCDYEDCKKSFGYARLLKEHIKNCHRVIASEF